MNPLAATNLPTRSLFDPQSLIPKITDCGATWCSVGSRRHPFKAVSSQDVYGQARGQIAMKIEEE